jgi:hypothetical protein
MNEKKTNIKVGRPSRSLEEEIAATEQRLLQLRTKKRDEEKREIEKNQKAILAMVKSAGLDSIPAEKWQAVIPKLTELLSGKKSPDLIETPTLLPKQTPVQSPAETGEATANE